MFKEVLDCFLKVLNCFVNVCLNVFFSFIMAFHAFSLRPVALYTAFIVFSLHKTLVKTLDKTLAI